MSANKVIVGCWAIRGRAGAIRSLLGYCSIPFENKVYTDADWYDEDKQSLGFDYPNFPYLIDGDNKISESLAILKYIAIRANRRDLIGDTDEKLIQVQTALGVTADLRTHLVRLVNTKGDYNSEKEETFTNGPVKEKLEVLNKNLGGKDWICGFISIVDFELFELIDLVKEIEPSELTKYGNLETFHKRFSELPAYKAYRESSEFFGVWGGAA